MRFASWYQKKPRSKRVKIIDSDDEEDQSAENAAVNEREAIASELFEGAEDTGEVGVKQGCGKVDVL